MGSAHYGVGWFGTVSFPSISSRNCITLTKKIPRVVMLYNRSLLHLRPATAVRLVARIEGNKDISHRPCRLLCYAFDYFYLGPIRKYV